MFSKLINDVLSKRENFKAELLKLEETIDSFITGNEQFHILEPFVLNKGKRIRSILYFMNWAQEKSSNVKYKTIALIEMIHFASIMHDDVIDNNFFRRNTASFMQKYGMGKSVILGDFLLVKAIDELLKLYSGNEMAKNFCLHECSATAYGAVLERGLCENSSFDECLRVTSLKTAPLFKLACFLGKFLSTGDFESAKHSAVFGLCFGTLFQIQNDLDSYGSEYFENSEDFTQKNITLPLIILRDHFEFDISKFYASNQNGYDEIRKLLHTERFQAITYQLLSKFIRFVSDS